MQNLETIDFVMTSDDLASGIREIAAALGKTPPTTVARSNLGTAGRRINIEDPAIRAVLAPLVKYDLRLYEFAKRMIGARRKPWPLNALSKVRYKLALNSSRA
jgi:hypothetical protein